MDPVVVHVPALRSAVPALRALLRRGAHVVADCTGPFDLGDVDALARLQLLATRVGARLEVRSGADGLLELTGLGLLRGRQGAGEPEAVEQRGVQEVVDVDELPG